MTQREYQGVGGSSTAARASTKKIAFIIMAIALLFSAGFLALLIGMNPPEEVHSGTLSTTDRERLMQAELANGRPKAALIVYAAAVKELQSSEGLSLACAQAHVDLQQLAQARVCLSDCTTSACQQFQINVEALN